MKKLNKELVLDYKKWRSGGDEDSKYQVGNGDTMLLNPHYNKMCCLGQFCLQSGFSKENISNVGLPDSLDLPIVGLTKKNSDGLKETKLTNQAVHINDDPNITTAQRTVKLQKLFKKCGYTITIKNFPKTVLKEIEEIENDQK